MNWKIKKGLGLILLAIWLIATGIFVLFRLSFEGQSIIMAILAIAAGVVILFER